MPELPEVETSRRGIEPHILGHKVTGVRVRQPRLRWPVSTELERQVPGQRVVAVERRAKYLLIRLQRGTLILHLGMSGSLRVLPADTPPGCHDHVDLLFGHHCLRLRDPRRFGALLWTRKPVAEHPLIRHLGPEPLTGAFSGEWLYRLARTRRVAVKSFIMDGRVVVGVGNIYASEALFAAAIHPQRPCNRIALARYRTLGGQIKRILAEAIQQGGTTLRDFQQEDGRPGYFARQLAVYGRAGQPCTSCGRPIKERRISQRSSFYCSHCQR